MVGGSGENLIKSLQQKPLTEKETNIDQESLAQVSY